MVTFCNFRIGAALYYVVAGLDTDDGLGLLQGVLTFVVRRGI